MVGLGRKRNQAQTEQGVLRWSQRWLRVARRILVGTLLALVGLIFMLTIVFLFAPTRTAVLGWGVGLADDALPGNLAVRKVDWPALGHLVFEDVVWVSDSASALGDTLADLAKLDLSLDLGALKHRDGRVESLVVDVRNLDIPAIVTATTDTTTESVPDSLASVTDPIEFPYLQQGSLPGFPSVIVEKLDLKVGRARLAPGMAIKDLVLSARAGARPDEPASLVIDHAGARVVTAVEDTSGIQEWEMVIEHLRLGLVLGFTTDASGDWTLDTAALDSLNLELAPTEFRTTRDILQASEPVSLKAVANIARQGREYLGHCDGNFVLPGSAHFQPWLPPDFPHEKFESVAGHFVVDGKYSDPQAEGKLRLDLGSNSWIDRGVIAAGAEADVDALRAHGVNELTVRLDTFDVVLEGIDVKASGNWRSGDFDLDLITALTDFHLIGLFAEGLDPNLDDLLQDPGSMSLNADAGVGRIGTEYSGRLDCDFDLPGASHFQAWLPEDFPHEDFESLVGKLAAVGNWADPMARGSVRLDLGGNTWAEKGLVSGNATANIDSVKTGGLRYLTARLDTLDLALDGLRVQASGGLDPQNVVLDLEGEVTDFLIPGVFAGPALADVELDIKVDATVTGSLDHPEIDAQVGGSFLQERITIPAFDFTLVGDRSNVAANLAAGGGLNFEGTSIDSVRAEVRGEMADLDSLTANFGLAVWREESHLALGGSVSGDTVRVIHLDSLVTVNFGKKIRTRGPATLTLGPGPNVFELTELELTGEPGTINLRGFWNENSRDLDGSIDLLVGEELLQQVFPSELWSLNGGVDLKLEATTDLEGGENDTRVAGRASAFLMPHRDEPPFGVAMEFTSLGGAGAVLNADFVLSSADTSLLEAQLVWPGRPGPKTGFWNPDPERDLVLTVPAQKLDLDRINRRLPDEVVLDGEFDIAGEVHVFPPHRGETEGGPSSPQPPQGSVEGTLGSPDLRIDLPNRSFLNTVVGATVSGSLADPRVAARVEVKSGFIRIPEIPRNLHQVEGVSLLWALNDSILALADSNRTDDKWGGTVGGSGDSLGVFLRSEQTGPALERSEPPALPDLDIEVAISDKLRIIGYGADIKLGGQFKVLRGYDEDNFPGPALKGNITIPEGTLKIMNRVFKFERGTIKFTESVPANPNLDLMLETQVNAYLLRVLVSGRAAAPVIELTSEPDLNEEDIMAVLLFGQPMSDLDGDQRGRMQEENDPSQELQKNLAGLAMAFGTRGLQDSMSDSFGVDVVSMGSDSSGGSTLMVGKFITPDILLKYNQSLENSGTYFMTLEYSLNRYFKIVSTYGQGEEASGAEVKWSKRY